MRKWLWPACAGFLSVGLAVLSTGCESMQYTDPGPGVYYANEYYPNEEIYYYPQGHIYYWDEDNGWRAGPTPPPGRTYDEKRHKFLWFGTRKTHTEYEVQTEQKKKEVHVVHVEKKQQDNDHHNNSKHHHWWRFW